MQKAERFTIRHTGTVRDPFGAYEYDILDGAVVIACYWHDYRGEDHGIRFADGSDEVLPGRRSDFVKGGGPKPLTLSAAAVKWLVERSSRWLNRKPCER